VLPLATIGSVVRTVSIGFCLCHAATALLRYRPRQYYLIVGVLGATFFSTMGIVSFVAAYWNIDGTLPRPLLAAIIFGIFWSAMVLLRVWVLLAYFREHLIVDRTAITQHGILRSTSVRIADATEIK
jgi:hypothetical protein